MSEAKMDVTIEKLVYGGEGLAHHDGRTIFVPFVLPNEVVTVRAVERKKKFVRGQVEQVVTTSPERAAAPCAHFTVCGGCHYQHIPYAAQLRYKAEILRETLWRLGRIAWPGETTTHASPPLGYRNRAQWKVRPAGDRLAIGYTQARSNTLCHVEECPILSPRLAATFAALRGALGRDRFPRTLREIEAFANADDEKILLNASFTEFTAAPEKLAEAFREVLPEAESILLHESSRDRFELSGPGFLHYSAAGCAYRVGHLSFFQANRFLVEEIVNAVAQEGPGGLALDLYAGVGLFSVPLARRFERVVAVESNAAAARDLEANLGASGAAARAVGAPVEEFLSDWQEAPELVVLDPPRAGAGARVLGRLAELGPARISYLSCDPATLARDLTVLAGAEGSPYAITEVHLFDIFPQTFHIESLVRLRRKG